MMVHYEWNGTKLLTAEEFRQHFKISRSTQQRMMRSGRLLPAHHFVRINHGVRSALRFRLAECEMALLYRTQA
jgi:hypothetical protein